MRMKFKTHDEDKNHKSEDILICLLIDFNIDIISFVLKFS